MTSNDKGTKNRLIDEKNPYLLQHANDPVDWYPWTKEAFEKAKSEDKPIFLSIGYSTCHWCHVMAKESFRNKDVAKMMNDTFVSIKVDREERPDIDSVYMDICQKMNGSGGWPLTIIMTPEKIPFIAATYIPRESGFGRKGMLEIIPWIEHLWKEEHNKIVEQTELIKTALSKKSESSDQDLTEEILHRTYTDLANNFDKENGGFGTSPKFPSPHNISYLLRYWKRTGNPTALKMVERTLQAMRKGGIYDHIGFGFHRYSTDSSWLVPHFEKMLYDQALLIIAYMEAYQATDKEEYSNTASEIIEYIIRDMTSPDGGFYCAEDADSEGVEGKFYTWETSEIESLLSSEDQPIFKDVFNIRPNGNFLDESTHQPSGKNILHTGNEIESTEKQYTIPRKEIDRIINRCRKQLFSTREKRIHPSKDDKILTDWNGLMLAALSISGRIMGNKRYIDIAKRNADLLISERMNESGELHHNYSSNREPTIGFLDDYAFFTWGLIELYEATFEVKYLENALKLTEYVIENFKDTENGGFFHTSNKSETLLFRKKDAYDGAMPSGNSVELNNLLRLSKLTGNPQFDREAINTSNAFASTIKAMPFGHTHFIAGLDLVFNPSAEIVIAGELDSEDTQAMLNSINREFIPEKTVIVKSEKNEKELERIAPYTATLKTQKQKATAYVCQNYECSLPTTNPQVVVELLKKLNNSH
ncbi:thioredoxin domain-containing protein [Methanococcoides sp. SA1]|nr:thioredoxin domain-containing protein [Methanococcoides sp. SA1]